MGRGCGGGEDAYCARLECWKLRAYRPFEKPLVDWYAHMGFVSNLRNRLRILPGYGVRPMLDGKNMVGAKDLFDQSSRNACREGVIAPPEMRLA